MGDQKGFTLVEIILASLLLLITLIGGVVFLSANRKNLVFASRQRLATWAAVSKMEGLKSTDYHSLQNSSENITLSGKPFHRTVTVENIDEDGGGTDYKKVTVGVSWSGGNLSLVTYIAPKE